MQTEIHFNIAQKQMQAKEQEDRTSKAKYLNEFRNSYCDMFDILDWQHYADKTGWSISKLREHAKYSEDKQTTVKDYLYGFLGSEIDEDDLFVAGF